MPLINWPMNFCLFSKMLHPPRYHHLALITGSEGGFAPEEAEVLCKAGAVQVGLGPRILRCETAPTAVLAAVMALTGNFE